VVSEENAAHYFLNDFNNSGITDFKLYCSGANGEDRPPGNPDATPPSAPVSRSEDMSFLHADAQKDLLKDRLKDFAFENFGVSPIISLANLAKAIRPFEKVAKVIYMECCVFLVELVSNDIAGYTNALAEIWSKLQHAVTGNWTKAEKEAYKKKLLAEGKFKPANPKKKAERAKKPRVVPLSTVGRVERVIKKQVEKDIKKPKGQMEGKKTVENVILSIAAPAVTAPVRYNTIFSTDETATARPVEPIDVAWPTTTTTATQWLNPGEMAGVLFRDPVRSSITYDSNTANEVSYYDAVFNLDPETDTPTGLTWDPPAMTFTDLEPDIAYFSADPTNSWNPHGDIVGSGEHGGKNGAYFLNGSSDALNITVTGTTTGQVLLVKLWKFEGEGWILETTKYMNHINTTIQITVDGAAYRRWTVAADSSSTVGFIDDLTFSAQWEHTGAVYAHRHIVDLTLQGETVKTVRVIGASMMYSNTTAVQFKSGNIAIAQVPKPNSWTDYLSYLNVTKVSGQKSGNAENGIFGFLKPNDYDDFKMIDYQDYDEQGYLTRFSYSIVPQSSFLVIFIANVNVSTIPQGGRWTFSHSIEYLTNNQWVEKRVANGDPKMFEEAITSVKLIPQFHENPFHLSDILGVAKRIANTVLQYGPAVMNFAQKVSDYKT